MQNKLRFNTQEKIILDDIEKNGGTVYFVGGIVRELLVGKPDYHDIDVEIYHLSLEELKKILSKYGHVNEIGQSFGILKLDTLPHFDFALPRIEVKSGETHRDFDVEVNENLDLKQACQRRDLTINALMYEYHSDKILDFFNGRDDLQHHTIKMINAKSFQEDPLRVLRVAQFAARYELTVDSKTKKLCRDMVERGMLLHLPKERIYDEYCKMLMANKPSIGLNFLLEIQALPKCLMDLKHCQQRLDYHPEGDVFTHTTLVVDLAALCKHKTSQPLAFMWSSLLHDIGKPAVTTASGSAPKHDIIGVDIFDQEMSSIIQGRTIKTYIKTMIRYHMVLMNQMRHHAGDDRYLYLLANIQGKVPFDDLVLMSKCDKLGRYRDGHMDVIKLDAFVKERRSRLGDQARLPMITGTDLKDIGFIQNPQFKELLEYSYDLQLKGHSKSEILEMLKEKKDATR